MHINQFRADLRRALLHDEALKGIGARRIERVLEVACGLLEQEKRKDALREAGDRRDWGECDRLEAEKDALEYELQHGQFGRG